MSEWTVHLEFEEGTSSKFWRARVEGKTLYVNYGKIGSNGQTQVKDFANAAGAQKEYEKLIGEKKKKGYVDSGGGGDEDEDEDEDDVDEADEEEQEDEEEEAAPKKKKAAAPAQSSGGSSRKPDAKLVFEAGQRKVETALYIDGKTVRMDATESYGNSEAAKKAFERLRKTLAGEGYKDA
jgi:predicted DNA-binding WGR domain protein